MSVYQQVLLSKLGILTVNLEKWPLRSKSTTMKIIFSPSKRKRRPVKLPYRTKTDDDDDDDDDEDYEDDDDDDDDYNYAYRSVDPFRWRLCRTAGVEITRF